MKETWQIAELLEEIAKRADPASVLARSIKNARNTRDVRFMVTVGHSEDECTASYFFPLEKLMDGVNGTPEEVIAYIQTGLTENESADIDADAKGRYFVLVQRRNSEHLASELRRLMGIPLE